MTLTVDMPVLLAAAAIWIAWHFQADAAQALARLQAERLRQQLEAAYGCPIVCMVGGVYDSMADRWVRELRRAERRSPKAIHVLIHTNGGQTMACSSVTRALAEQKALVVAHVPLFAWSAGAGLALACDAIRMDHDGVLGPCDPGRSATDDTVFCAPSVIAHETGKPYDVVRDATALNENAERITSSRAMRRRMRSAAPEVNEREAANDRRLVELLVRGGWGNHWRPIFIENGQELGLAVEAEYDPRWAKLARLCEAALPANLR